MGWEFQIFNENVRIHTHASFSGCLLCRAVEWDRRIYDVGKAVTNGVGAHHPSSRHSSPLLSQFLRLSSSFQCFMGKQREAAKMTRTCPLNIGFRILHAKVVSTNHFCPSLLAYFAAKFPGPRTWHDYKVLQISVGQKTGPDTAFAGKIWKPE